MANGALHSVSLIVYQSRLSIILSLPLKIVLDVPYWWQSFMNNESHVLKQNSLTP